MYSAVAHQGAGWWSTIWEVRLNGCRHFYGSLLPQVASGFLLRVWPAHYKAVSALSFTKCGTYLVTGGRDGLLHLWDAIR